jgi:membrane fusion protein (multidrug efflux system)
MNARKAKDAMNSMRRKIGSVILVTAVIATGAALAAWKTGSIKQASAASANQPEPMELVTTADAVERAHRETTTAIGTVLALRSITLRNELSGTVRDVRLVPGQIVEAGAVLVALDVSVEEADLRAHEAQAQLAETVLKRAERLLQDRARFVRPSARASASAISTPAST